MIWTENDEKELQRLKLKKAEHRRLYRIQDAIVDTLIRSKNNSDPIYFIEFNTDTFKGNLEFTMKFNSEQSKYFREYLYENI